jgi:DNA polymerase elongation subunit (family B)
MKKINIPDEEMYNWVYAENGKSTKVKCWDSQSLVKKRSTYLNKFRIFEFINKFDEDLKSEIFNNNKPKHFYLDIEVDYDDEFPYPEQAKFPVNTIAFCGEGEQIFVMATKPLTETELQWIGDSINKYLEKFGIKWKLIFKKYDSECAMLFDFAHKIVCKFPALTGWYFVEFDWTYLINRSKKFDISLGSLSSPTGKVFGRNELPKHRLVYDYQDVYIKWDRSVAIKEQNSLDWVSEEVLGVQKIKYSGSLKDLYERDFAKYVYYNAIDTILVRLIAEKLNTYDTFKAIAKAAEVPIEKAFQASQCTEKVFSMELMRKGIHLTNEQPKWVDFKKQPKGAYVHPPTGGFYRGVVCADFASMYPMLSAQYNISPESYLGVIEPDGKHFKHFLTNEIIEIDPSLHITTAADTVFDKIEDSVYRVAIRRIYTKRFEKKHLAKELSNEITQLKELLKTL